MQTIKYSDRHKVFAGKVIISYPMKWGGHFKDAGAWMAELNGQIEDYGAKDQLIKDALANGLDYVVLRVHRNFTATNIACSGQVAGAGKSDGESTPSATCH